MFWTEFRLWLHRKPKCCTWSEHRRGSTMLWQQVGRCRNWNGYEYRTAKKEETEDMLLNKEKSTSLVTLWMADISGFTECNPAGLGHRLQMFMYGNKHGPMALHTQCDDDCWVYQLSPSFCMTSFIQLSVCSARWDWLPHHRGVMLKHFGSKLLIENYSFLTLSMIQRGEHHRVVRNSRSQHKKCTDHKLEQLKNSIPEGGVARSPRRLDVHLE